jgi:tetratricopeptide (TPR) repeat protein
MPTNNSHPLRLFSLGLPVVGLLLMLSCTAPLPTADPERAAQLRNKGMKFELKHDFTAAIRPYVEATRYDPENSSAYLKAAEFQTAGGEPQAAYNSLERALRYISDTNSDRELIIYRSALLLAAKLNKTRVAEKLMKQLTNIVYKSDLAGVIALHRNEARKALKQFQTALKYDMTPDQQARIYFHAAQAYGNLGDAEHSSDALLLAIPKATSRDLKEDIRHFFEAQIAR